MSAKASKSRKRLQFFIGTIKKTYAEGQSLPSATNPFHRTTTSVILADLEMYTCNLSFLFLPQNAASHKHKQEKKKGKSSRADHRRRQSAFAMTM
eukprot:1347158-Amorphochlora_amoeboformis.AAC.2